MWLVLAILLATVAASPTRKGAGAALAMAAAPAKAGREDQEFVRACCARTLYPGLCAVALVPYAAAVHSSHARLAVASANVTLAALTSLAGRIPSSDSDSGSSGAVRDCAEAVSSASDLAAQAARRLDGVDQAVGPEVLWRVDDAQTWLSAVMTYEDTCADALRPARSAPAPVRAELRAGVRRAMHYTSIALALVNMLVRN